MVYGDTEWTVKGTNRICRYPCSVFVTEPINMLITKGKEKSKENEFIVPNLHLEHPHFPSFLFWMDANL